MPTLKVGWGSCRRYSIRNSRCRGIMDALLKNTETRDAMFAILLTRPSHYCDI